MTANKIDGSKALLQLLNDTKAAQQTYLNKLLELDQAGVSFSQSGLDEAIAKTCEALRGLDKMIVAELSHLNRLQGG